MKIAISCDSVCDLPKDVLKYYDIKTMPCQIMINHVVYYDTIDITNEAVIDYMSNTKALPTTIATQETEYVQHFNKLLKSFDAVIHICVSSNLSNNYFNASSAIKSLKNVYIIDSLSVSAGLGLLAIYASNLAQRQLQPKTIAQKLNERKKNIYFGCLAYTTAYLNQSPKPTGVKPLGNNLLNIKPVLEINSIGEFVLKNKYRGKSSELAPTFIDEILKAYPELDKSVACVVYGDVNKDIKDTVSARLASYGLEDVIECNPSSAVLSHCGKDVIALAFYKQPETTQPKKRK